MQTNSYRSSGKILLPVIVVLIMIVAGGSWYWYHQSDTQTTSSAQTQQNKAKGRGHKHRMGMRQAQPVYVGAVTMANVPVYLNALGSVQANSSVTITSRVSGTLEQVYFTEGQYVKKGQLLARIDDRAFQATLKQYQGNLAQHQALLQNAKLTLTRYKKLYQQDSLSKQDLQGQIAEVGQYLGLVEADQAQIDSAKLNIDYSRIHSPISGYAGLRLTDPGNLVNADNTEILNVSQTRPIAVVFSIAQANLSDVVPGLRKGDTFPVNAYNQTGKKLLGQGQLKFVSNQIDSSTGTVKLKAIFPNRKNILYPNQFVNVRLQIKTLKDAIVAPQAAVQLSSSGKFVYVIDKKDKAHKKVVVTGPPDGDDRIVIVKGLKAGQQVATTGIDDLFEGSQVTIVKAPSKDVQ
ncbi:MdtA/MuxA family multidrug efflux RND transporter periplasmic adaptor subunit [Celerinatantimonas diazotrophica]|uniref:Multidrug efflux system membrane fusion protein n=1 Tax=Celerinatantimonas diazotrophica TaxID=412034 RepID=A0A4R1J9J9_9GAMM|nr:MdtA/MuxA family multidrug efflux RND transporter periplasmic adaptor subunit [Celerinatantimonas diazotrophica]TCK46779.1 multidrug efflux system membrane fusion protein [Celerinatantimonas diazotrophica]CAG9295482.1 Multidrug resistance protein MdtA [Celerinatantimonas diazotrophica]